MKRKLLSSVLILSIVLSMFISTKTDVSAVADITPPVLNSISISSASGNPGDKLTITANASDDISGVQSINVVFQSPFGARNYASLSAHEDVFQGDLTIGQYAETGTWQVVYISLYDYSNNNISIMNSMFYPDMPPCMDFSNMNFTVNPHAKSDGLPPIYVSASVTPAEANPGETVTVKIIADENISGISYINISYTTPSGTFGGYKYQHFSKTSVPPENDEYVMSFAIGEYDDSGLWKAENIGFEDYAGNNIWYMDSSMYPNAENSIDLSGLNYTVKENPNADNTPPILNSILISPKEGKTGNKLTYTIDAYDDLSGLDYVEIVYLLPSGPEPQGTDPRICLNPVYADGKYTAQIELYEGMEVGLWTAYRYIIVRDKAGNFRWYDPTQIDFSNINFTVLPSPTVSYTVKFQNWDGSILKTQQVQSGGSATSPSAPIRASYAFSGWNRAYNNVTSDLTVTATYSDPHPGIRAFVTRVYQQCLGRNPDEAGLADWVSQLASGNTTAANVAYGFVFSGEFQNSGLSNEQYVTIMYRAFFNRDPDPAGYNSWITSLNNGLSRYYVLAGFVNSQEFKSLSLTFGINSGSLTFSEMVDLYPNVTSFVNRFYQQCLSRNADPAGLNDCVTQLVRGTGTGSQIAYGFVFSNEFQNRGLNNDQFVTIMYRAFFNRDPDPTGYSTWISSLNNGLSRYYVLAGFVNSQEFKSLSLTFGINSGSLTFSEMVDLYPNVTSFVNRFYQQCLSRNADPAGLNDWVTQLVRGTGTGSQIAYGFVFSNEFQNRGLNNDQFVTIMYRAFFNRDPDPTGYSGWLSALNVGNSRYQVLAGFVNSQEFMILCQNYMINPGVLR